MIKKKRIIALVLALVMMLSTVVSAYAVQVWVRYKQYVYSSQVTFYQYDYSSSTYPSIQQLTILEGSSLGSGSALYHVKEVNGEYGYCIQPGVHSDDSSNYRQGSSACWYNLPASVQSGIALALACGFPEASYGTASGDRNSSDIIIAEKWAATQCVIWELICDYLDPYTYTGGYSPLYYCVNTGNYPTFALWYDCIVGAMRDSLEIPSFAERYSGRCEPIELTSDASTDTYSVVLTDNNRVLAGFPFKNCSGDGITFTQNRNTLTITATAEAAKNLTEAKTFSTIGSAYDMNPNEAVLCYYDSTGKYQSLANATGVGLDPVKAYIKLVVPVQTGSLSITKTDADTGELLSGVIYRLYNSSGDKVADATTGADGKAVFSSLAFDSYTYQEIETKEGYILDDTMYSIVIASDALNVSESRTNTTAKGSITLHKVDAGNHPLPGVTLLLEQSTDNGATWNAVESKTTDADGIVKWADLMAKEAVQYRITETDTVSGYSLLAEPIIVGALPHDGMYDVSITACNTQIMQLPFTGGNGFAVTILFAALAMMAGVFYCKNSINLKKENN